MKRTLILIVLGLISGCAGEHAPPEVPAAPRRDSSGGMTLGFDGVSIEELLRPAMPFTPPAHLGPRRVVLLPRSERPEKKLSVFFLDALRALGAS